MALKLFVFLAIVLLCIRVCDASVVQVDLEYDAGAGIWAFNSSKLLEIALPGGIRAESEYKWVLYSVTGAVLDSGNITPPGPIIIEGDPTHNISGQIIYPGSQVITVYFGYNPSLRNLVVHDISNELLNIDLMQYNRCNLNSVCEPNENHLLCPEDCQDSAKDGVCANIEDGICKEDPDCTNRDPDCIIQEAIPGPQGEINATHVPKPGNQTNKETVHMNPTSKPGSPIPIVIPLLVIAILFLLGAIVFYIIKTRSSEP